jgi:phosphomannomutase
VVRNISTTHLLDKVAEGFGETCYEVPVGFKHISSKMNETDAVIGGESSGGLTVRGHIKGKDGVYAATLLVEMIAVVGKKLSEIVEDIHREYGFYYLEERDYHFSREKKEEIYRLLLVDRLIPEFPFEILKISYLDGCKIYFKNGGWIGIRFSGTEPLLRMFCEMPVSQDEKLVCRLFANFLGLEA